MNTIKFPARQLLGDGKLSPFVFCESCNNWREVVLRTRVRHRLRDGIITLDENNLLQITDYLAEYHFHFSDMQLERVQGGKQLSDMEVDIANEAFDDDYAMHGDEERFRGVFSKLIIPVCVNCGAVMSTASGFRVQHCDAKCPGCYLCQDPYVDESRTWVVKFCARCVQRIGIGKTPPCQMCIYEYSKNFHSISLSEINTMAANLPVKENEE